MSLELQAAGLQGTEHTHGSVFSCLRWKWGREGTPNKFLLFGNTMGNLKALLGACAGAFPIRGDEGDCHGAVL